jgi:hypothetical protein
VLYPAGTGGFDTYSTQSTAITPTSGVHNLYLVAPGTSPGHANIDYFSFTHMTEQLDADTATSPEGVHLSSGGTGIVATLSRTTPLEFSSVNFGSGDTTFSAFLATSNGQRTTIDVRIDGPNGPTIGTITVPAGSSAGVFTTLTTHIPPISGLHALTLVVTGSGNPTLQLDHIDLG